MKRIAIVLSGGIGLRFGNKCPKQYTIVNDKPVLFYTIENLEKSKYIDAIYIAAADEWKDFILEGIDKYNISKFCGIYKGGNTGLESIWNCFINIMDKYNDEDVIIIQDGNRINTNDEIICDGINIACDKEMSISVLKQIYAEVFIDDEKISMLDRNKLFELQRPEFFKLKKLKQVYKISKEKEFKTQAPSTIMVENNEKIYFCKGDGLNIKITYPEDIEIFKAILSLKNNK